MARWTSVRLPERGDEIGNTSTWRMQQRDFVDVGNCCFWTLEVKKKMRLRNEVKDGRGEGTNARRDEVMRVVVRSVIFL
jgi:hypothetical protein